MNKLCLAMVLLSAFGTANAVELIDDNRKVEIFSTGGNSEATPNPAFSTFTTNGQNTAVSADQFSGSGDGYGESDFDFYIRQSIFDITFAANGNTTIDLGGTFVANAGDFGAATVRVELIADDPGNGPTVVYADALSADSFDEVTADFSFNDVLESGTYRLALRTDITPGGFDTYGSFSFSAQFETQADSDNDGVPDAGDNCLVVANANQIDADGDGFGNVCDADLNNDCIVNATDLGMLRLVFFSADATADFNSDGVVNVTDLGIMRIGFFALPGPSGVNQSCMFTE